MRLDDRYVVVDAELRRKVWERLCGADLVSSFSAAYQSVGKETNALLIVKSDLLNANEVKAVLQHCASMWPACYIAVPTQIALASHCPEPDFRFKSVLNELLVVAVDLPTAIRRKAQVARDKFGDVMVTLLEMPYERLLETYPHHLKTIDNSWWLVDEEKVDLKRQVFESMIIGLMESGEKNRITRLRAEYVACGGTTQRLRHLAQERHLTYLFGDE